MSDDFRKHMLRSQIKGGGIKDKPSTPKPDVDPIGQQPPPTPKPASAGTSNQDAGSNPPKK